MNLMLAVYSGIQFLMLILKFYGLLLKKQIIQQFLLIDFFIKIVCSYKILQNL